jgi:hypothetical protein
MIACPLHCEEMTAMSAAERIYQKYIKSLSADERARLLELLQSDLERGDEDITALEGLGASIWEDVDTDDHVDELRDDWESRR